MTCKLKPYITALDARSTAVCLNRKSKYKQDKAAKGVKVVAYQCRICSQWHIQEVAPKSKPSTQELESNGNYCTH